jgi:hypothetical protein
MYSEYYNIAPDKIGNGMVPVEDERPELVEIRNDYRWTPLCQRAFLEALAYSGSVTRAASEVCKSARSAYNLRFRRDGVAFRLGWDAAILVSRYALHDMLMDRAINGQEESSNKQEDGSTLRGRFDNRLGMNLLGRLDRMAETQAMQSGRETQIQLIVQDFEGFLDLIERGGKGSEAALFFEARDPSPMEQVSPQLKSQFECELDELSDDHPVFHTMLDIEPEVAAKEMGVWFDPDVNEWHTDFPKPDGDDLDYITEYGQFGANDYTRTLSHDEEKAAIIENQRELQPLLDAAAKRRDEWLAEQLAA